MSLLFVRDGKRGKNPVTLLPGKIVEPLSAHLEMVRRQYGADLANGAGRVESHWAKERNYPSAPQEWGWRWVSLATWV